MTKENKVNSAESRNAQSSHSVSATVVDEPVSKTQKVPPDENSWVMLKTTEDELVLANIMKLHTARLVAEFKEVNKILHELSKKLEEEEKELKIDPGFCTEAEMLAAFAKLEAEEPYFNDGAEL